MPVLTVDSGYYAGVRNLIQKPYQPPQYRTQRCRCWMCGRFVTGGRLYARRKCDRCQVAWNEAPPRTTAAFQADYRKQALDTWEKRFLFRPGEEWADEFDRFIDHGNTHLPSPA